MPANPFSPYVLSRGSFACHCVQARSSMAWCRKNVGSCGLAKKPEFDAPVTACPEERPVVDAPPTDPFSPADSQAVIDALFEFVEVHQALLEVAFACPFLVIGKDRILSQIGFMTLVAAVLRQLEAAIDTPAFAIIALLSDGIDDAKAQVASLDATLDRAIAAYS
ncbi:hypothetical protein AURDEDRAFT_158071 [Auricularia subglabra TFB-10046 SS5]|nr:hypothetical protein AURDEDRAFT_158071 [Auricularia subglabra TFB-10046 SS5]